MTRVAVLGGGVGGLSAAHELVERGFEVAVYEQKSACGGKARSYGKPGSGAGGRPGLPAEHGFRLFPGFYRHLGHTMKRIPYGDNPHGVFDNLVTACRAAIAFETKPPVVAEAHFPKSPDEWYTALRSLFLAPEFGIPPTEVVFFVRRLLVMLTSCQERRLAEYEGCTWWDFVEADGKSEAYQRLLGDGLIRRLVAMKGRQANARTMGTISIQLLQDLVRPGQTTDRVLNGPTNEVWIDPWVRYLEQHGVEIHLNAPLQRLNYDGQRITSATVETDGRSIDVVADYYACAVPVEAMQRLAVNLKEGAPSLAHLDQLHTEWMTGIQFYLRRDVPVLRGHVVYADSQWALTSISQHQFWRQVDLSQYGNGEVQGILSVDISDWHAPGDQVVRKPAAECAAAEIQAEVWAQMKAHLDEGGQRQLEDADMLDWSLDPGIQFPCSRPENERNLEPLLINTAGSWQHRPEADLSNGVYREIPNLFLAADYVRTHTDLATMEGANEAARRAVNGILKAAGSRAEACGVWPLEEPVIFAPLRAYDYTRFKLGYPHSLPDLDPRKGYLTGARSLEQKTSEVLKSNHYRFQAQWHVEATVQEVWKLIAEPCTYPGWWRQYPKVRRLNDLQGVGASWEVYLHSSLPYQLRCVIEMIRCEEPSLAEWRVRGDLNGRDCWTLKPTTNGTLMAFNSQVSTGKLLLTLLSPAARRFFVWNHAIMMKEGEQELRRALARSDIQSGIWRACPEPGRLAPPGGGEAGHPPDLGRRTAVVSDAAPPDRFQFRLHWTAEARAEAVWTLVAEPCTFPDWWHPYRWVRRLNSVSGIGAIWQVRVQFSPDLPFCLNYSLEMVRCDAPRLVEWLARGDLNGRLGFTVEESPAQTRITYYSDLHPGRRLQVIPTAVGRRLFFANHDAVMNSGEKGLRAELSRRSTSGVSAVSQRPARLLIAPGEGKSFRSLESLVTVKATAGDTNGVYSISEARDPPQRGSPPHIQHRIDVGYFILEGRYAFQIGNQTFTATSGSFALVPKRVIHSFKNVGVAAARRLVIASPAGYTDADLDELVQLSASAPDPAKLSALVTKLGTEMQATAEMDSRLSGWRLAPAPPAAGGRNGTDSTGTFLPPGGGKSFHALGSSLTFKAMSEDTGGVYSLFEVQDPPRGGQPPHLFYETDGAAYVLEGEYVFQVGGRSFPARPGSLVFLPRGVWHHWTNVGATTGCVLEIASPAGIEKLIAEVSRCASGVPDRDRLLAITRKHGADMKLPPP